jgi:hypothetical protein
MELTQRWLVVAPDHRGATEVVAARRGAVRAVIIEGRAARHLPRLDEAACLAAASKAKYGYAPPVEAYASGAWAVSPRRVLAWDGVAEHATRFEFARAE